MLYGEKGIGKSTLASQFPDVTAYFMWEALRRGLKAPIIPDPKRNEEPLTWPRYQSYLDMLYNEYEPGRVVVDSLDLCAKAWESHWANVKGVTSLLGIQDHGRTWDICMDDWSNTHARMVFAGWRFTFTSHVRKRPKTVRGVAREEIADLVEAGVIPIETQPSTRPWALGWSKEPVAYAGYYGWYGEERTLQIRGSGTIYAACENSEDHFLQPKGTEYAGQPYHLVPMGSKGEDSFKRLQLAWDNKIEGYFLDDGSTDPGATYGM